MALAPGDLVTLVIEKPVAGGRALARQDGRVVLVAGAIPGERVAARIERMARGVTLATTVEILEASPDRRDGGDCRCGGNVYGFIAYPRQLELKRSIVEDAFARVGRAPLSSPPAVVPSPETGSRLRVRLHTGLHSGGRRLGFYREGSHDWCDAVATGHLSPAAAAWVDGANGGDDGLGLSRVQSVELAETIDASARAAHVVLQPGTPVREAATLGGGLQGLSAQAGDRGACRTIVGSTTLVDRVRVGGASGSELTLRRDVQAFFQGNRFLVPALVDEVARRALDGPVVDLYAGVGLFGLSLVALGAEDVTLVEGDEVSGRWLAENAVPFQTAARVVQGSVEAYCEDVVRRGLVMAGSTVVVDPPRTGLSPAALAGILRLRPRHVVYVSCDPPTLARDVRALTDAGYGREDVTILDMFPRTAHIETVVRLTRR